MTRSLAPRPRARARPPRKIVAPDPNTVHHFQCLRCQRLMWTRGIATECHNCIDHAIKAWELGPIQGEMSGA